MFLPAASAAVYPNRRSAAEFQPVIVPSSDFVMMASLEDSTAALNRRSRSAWWSRAAIGAAMLLHLAFERDGLCIRFLHHLRERAREHAGLAAGIDRNDGLAVTRGALDRLGQLDDRPGQRSRDQQRQHGRAQHRDQSDGDRAVLDRRRRRHEDGVAAPPG